MDAGSDRGVTGGVRKPPHLRLFWQVTARRRVFMTAAVGVVAGVVAALFTPWQVSTLIGWDVAAVLNVSWVATTAGRFDANETRRFATREDDSRFSAQFLLLGAGVASLVGVGFDLVKASQTQGAGKGFLVGMGGLQGALLRNALPLLGMDVDEGQHGSLARSVGVVGGL